MEYDRFGGILFRILWIFATRTNSENRDIVPLFLTDIDNMKIYSNRLNAFIQDSYLIKLDAGEFSRVED